MKFSAILVVLFNFGIVSISSVCFNQSGYDIPGHDLTRFNEKELEDCCQLCSKEPGCRAYVWNKDHRMCYLKDSDEPIVANDGGTVGLFRVEVTPTTTQKWKRTTPNPGVTDSQEEYSCSDPLNPGVCRASITRYYYNTEKNQCLKYDDGGCGQYKNKFPSKEVCEEKCVKTIVEESPKGRHSGR